MKIDDIKDKIDKVEKVKVAKPVKPEPAKPKPAKPKPAKPKKPKKKEVKKVDIYFTDIQLYLEYFNYKTFVIQQSKIEKTSNAVKKCDEFEKTLLNKKGYVSTITGSYYIGNEVVKLIKDTILPKHYVDLIIKHNKSEKIFKK